MAEARKLHEPVLDHNGNPFSPAQILALERAELTKLRFKRDAMILAERREELIEMSVVQRQAAAIFAACRQKLLLIPHSLAHRLVGKDYRAIHDAITAEIHQGLAGDGRLCQGSRQTRMASWFDRRSVQAIHATAA